MMPQFASKFNLTKRYKNITLGLFIFSIGLFKKVVIADTFSEWVNYGYGAEYLNMLEAWATSLSYTFQLYFDFSGYTDMAIGAALLFNIKLPINFNSPYKATSIQDFWRRWHITLSRFLKDYIYIPLGGNRKGTFKTYLNLLITFLIGGIWHGAGWTFILWGVLHGFALIINHIWNTMNIKLPKIIAWFITFNFINITWVFFRAETFEDAKRVLSFMFFGDFVLPYKIVEKYSLFNNVQAAKVFEHINASSDGIIWLIAAFIVVLGFKNSVYYLHNFIPNKINGVIMYLFFVISFLHFTRVSEFLYFNF